MSAHGYARVLGVSCTSSASYFALVVDGRFLDCEPRRIEPAEVLAGGDKLAEFRDRMRREISQCGAQMVVIVTSTYQAVYEKIAPRVTQESLIRLAAADERVPSELVHQRTVRKRLGLPKTGDYGSCASRYLAGQISAAPMYWREGRAEACAAALACGMPT